MSEEEPYFYVCRMTRPLGKFTRIAVDYPTKDPLLVVRDFGLQCGYSTPQKLLDRLPHDVVKRIHIIDAKRRRQESIAVRRPGWHNLIMRSNKPQLDPVKALYSALAELLEQEKESSGSFSMSSLNAIYPTWRDILPNLTTESLDVSEAQLKDYPVWVMKMGDKWERDVDLKTQQAQLAQQVLDNAPLKLPRGPKQRKTPAEARKAYAKLLTPVQAGEKYTRQDMLDDASNLVQTLIDKCCPGEPPLKVIDPQSDADKPLAPSTGASSQGVGEGEGEGAQEDAMTIIKDLSTKLQARDARIRDLDTKVEEAQTQRDEAENDLGALQDRCQVLIKRDRKSVV